MLPTRSDNVTWRVTAISFSPRQNASSRLTLVLCPAMTMERLTTGDFIDRLPFRPDVGRARGGPSRRARTGDCVRLCCGHAEDDWPPRFVACAAVPPICAPHEV